MPVKVCLKQLARSRQMPTSKGRKARGNKLTDGKWRVTGIESSPERKHNDLRMTSSYIESNGRDENRALFPTGHRIAKSISKEFHHVQYKLVRCAQRKRNSRCSVGFQRFSWMLSTHLKLAARPPGLRALPQPLSLPCVVILPLAH